MPRRGEHYSYYEEICIGDDTLATFDKTIRQNIRPFIANAGIEFLAVARDKRERVAAPVWNTSIDHHPRITPISFVIKTHRVEMRTPATRNNIDVFTRVAARTQ